MRGRKGKGKQPKNTSRQSNDTPFYENLKAIRDRLLEFLEQAETIEQSLKIIEEDIVVIEERVNFLCERTAFSTISLAINPWIPTPTPSPTPMPHNWTPSDTAKRRGRSCKIRLNRWQIF